MCLRKYFGRLFSVLSCLLLPLTRVRLVRLLSLHLRLQFSILPILMLRLVLSLSLVLLLLLPLSATSAYAQTETPTPVPTPTDTPTPTYSPLFPTHTPAPTQFYDCPDYLPVGWGTVTPDPYWLFACRQCLPTESYPTLTPYPTSTYLASTPTLSATLTPTPTATSFPVGSCNVWFDDWGMSGEWEYHGVSSTIVPTVSSNGSVHLLNVQYALAPRESSTSPYPEAKFFVAFRSDVGNGDALLAPGESMRFKVYWLSGHVTTEYCQSPYDCHGALFDVGWGDWYINANSPTLYAYTEDCGVSCVQYRIENVGSVPVRFYSLVVRPIRGDVGYPGGMTIEGGFAVQLVDWEGSTCYSPASQSYCASVYPYDPLTSEDAFSLPVILVGPRTCVEIPAVDLSDVPVVSALSFPGLSVCFVPVQLGTLKVFGVPISMDSVALLLTGVAVLRIFVRS